MEGIYARRLKKVVILFMMMSFFNLISAGSFDWTGEKYIGDWNGKAYGEGWSSWSTSVPSSPNNSMYVKAKVYIPVKSWGSQSCSYSQQSVITTATIGNNTVRKEEGSYTKYNSRWERESTYCGGEAEDYKTSYTAGCNCWLGNTPTGWCVKSGAGMCGDIGSQPCGSPGGYTQKCYYLKCQQNQKTTESGCNSDFSSNSDQGCGSRRTYCYYTSSSFLDASNSANWKTSLSSAGGYAKEVYIYSYPTRVYINYNANGTDLICGNGTSSSWTSGANSYNINTGIKYVDGNPVCNTGFTTNSMATSYIDYTNGGNLRVNQYYKIGHDFKGWALTPNGNVVFNQDGQRVTSTQLKARPGETITLYAKWQIHDYKVTFSYLCGSISNITYNYGTGKDLNDLNVASCKNGNANSNATFLGWYEDIGYTKKLEKIPSSYYKDLTLYAKIRETRYFNYKNGKWEYTK